jgi:hypothetical protein
VAGLAVPGVAAQAGRRVVPVIGARAAGSSLADFAAADQAIGPLRATRIFYRRALPPSVAGTVADRLPAGVIPVVSYKEPGTNVAAWCRSVRRVTWLIFHHEPEGGDFPSGQAFTDEFARQSALIRSAGNRLVRVVMCAGGFAYRDGGPGTDGSYLPDRSLADRVTLDVYQYPDQPGAWPAHGLADYDRFGNWLELAASLGLLWGLSEYGVGRADGTSLRRDRIAADRDTLRRAAPRGGGLVLWSYWWHDNPPHSCRFTGRATVALWRDIAAHGI